tara:strand:- start:3732 stop:4721 length:990 start_codon:yes stop_codon:yes gene_type:complete
MKVQTGYISALAFCTILLNACVKEESNSAPQVLGISVFNNVIYAGDTTTLSATVTDEDEDEMQYNWSASKGSFPKGSIEKNTVWKGAFFEGTHDVKCTVSDGKAQNYKKNSVIVNGFIHDNFDEIDSNWKLTNATVNNTNNRTEISVSDSSDAVYLHEFDGNITPPYSILMSTGIASNSSTFSNADKYGVLLDFYNVGSDTIVKALWVRVYPSSSIKNWRVSVYEDTGNKNSWKTIESQAEGIDGAVETSSEDLNDFQITVDVNNMLNITVNGVNIYSNNILKTSFLSGGNPPALILQKIGVRSTTGTVFIDDVYITRDFSKIKTDVFN